MQRALLLLAMAGALVAATPVTRDAASLDWLAGHWVDERAGRWAEESWLPARGGLLLGLNRSGRGALPAMFEFMRIGPGVAGRLTFFGSPGGAPPVAFELTEATDQSAVFENPAHDFPTIVRYRRDGDRLFAEVSGPGGAEAQRWTFVRR